MSVLPRTSMEQWVILRAVVRLGGFAPAAEALHKSQSAISYAMNRLQDAVGAPLLQLHGRRAVLTPEGDALLKEALPLIDAFLRLEQRAQGMARGDSLQIRILVDSMYPRARLFTAIGQLAQRYPLAAVHVQESVRIPFEAARVQDFDLAIVIAEPGVLADPAADVQLLPVASIHHPLASLPAPLSNVTLNSYSCADIRGPQFDDAQPGLEGRLWKLGTVHMALEAVRSGLCYAWLPRHLVDPDLRLKQLVTLSLAEGSTRRLHLGLICKDAAAAHPAVLALADLLREAGAQPG